MLFKPTSCQASSTHSRRAFLHTLLLASLWLTACASMDGDAASPSEPPAQEAAASAPPAAAVSGQWEGRLSIKLGAFKTETANGSQMAFELEVRDGQGSLSLSTPLGTRMAMVRWTSEAFSPWRAQLETSDGIEHFGSLDTLTAQLLGEALPLQAMLHWLKGHPAPNTAFEAAPGQNTEAPRLFTQAGWQVDATALGEGRLNASRPESAAQRSVTLRLRLDL